MAVAGCRLIAPQPPMDFSGPGWVVRQGQAVWKPNAKAAGVAGELLVATHPDGRGVVQFTKTPIPFLVAQRTTNSWQVQFVPHNKAYAGRGEAPTRLLWLHLPEALARRPIPATLRFTTNTGGGFRLERSATGESIKGFLEPSHGRARLLPSLQPTMDHGSAGASPHCAQSRFAP